MKRDEERVKSYGEEIVLEGKASEIGIDDFQSNQSLDETYRTCFLRGLFAHMKRGFYHDGRFATLLDVNLTEQEKNDLVQFLKSL